MSRSRNDFYFAYDPSKIVATRKKRGLTIAQVSRKAGVKDSSYSMYEHGKIKRASGEKAVKIAAALHCKVESLFENYAAAKEEYEAGMARLLTADEKEKYAVDMLNLVKYFVNNDLYLWCGDFEEGLSESLFVFWDVLDHFKKPRNETETITALQACIKLAVHNHAVLFYKRRRAVELVSLEDIVCEWRHGEQREVEDVVCSPYDLEEHVEAREELRLRLRYADDDTRRIILEELSL